jgi:hypothetical protein
MSCTEATTSERVLPPVLAVALGADALTIAVAGAAGSATVTLKDFAFLAQQPDVVDRRSGGAFGQPRIHMGRDLPLGLHARSGNVRAHRRPLISSVTTALFVQGRSRHAEAA